MPENTGFSTVSRGSARITRAMVEAAWADRAPGLRAIHRDAMCRGLALVVGNSSMSWVYAYRPNGLQPSGKRWPNRTVTLGNPGSMTPDEARRAASAIKGEVAAGGDPSVDRRRQLAAAQRQRANTIGLMAQQYALILPARPKLRGSGKLGTRALETELAALRASIREMDAETLPAEQLTAAMIRRMIGLHGSQPGAARSRFGALSRFLDWAMDDERIELNPCVMISRASRPKPVQARAAYLSVAQLAQLWKAADKLEPVHRDFARFLIAIPCRRGEATALDWRQLDLAGATWSQDGKATKNGEDHRFHLHALALALLQRRHIAAGTPRAGLVFPAPKSGGLLSTWRDTRADLVAEAGFDGWRWHDFRRSFATALAEASIPEAVADAILNHKQSATRGDVLGVYQRANRWPEQCIAMKRWGDLLRFAIGDSSNRRPKRNRGPESKRKPQETR